MTRCIDLGGLLEDTLAHTSTVSVRGRVVQVLGTMIRAAVPGATVGELCVLRNPGDSETTHAEVVGFMKDTALLAPLGEMNGIGPATEVVPTGRSHEIGVGPELLGRVLDGLGRPMDEATQGPLRLGARRPVHGEAPAALERRIIDRPLELGVRAIDATLTCGEGQRVGIFAAAGGGKSTLLGMLLKGTEADVTVLALIGERGREVREFIEHELGPEGLRKAVVVCATSDRSALERVKAAHVATAIAEYFRDQGKRVLLLMDSVTRFARAQREIGLAAGEPPTRRGFPPSVFAALPRLMERAGMNRVGSITGFYTVLVEGDDMTEPIADETRSILDGHIVLSRKLAMANHYPAIDILASTSRLMHAVAPPQVRAHASRLRELMARYAEVELLVRIGEYESGTDALADEAIARQEAIRAFLCQDRGECVPMDRSAQELAAVVEGYL